MKNQIGKALLRWENIPALFLMIQLGLAVWEKQGRTIPVPLCPVTDGWICLRDVLISPYCTYLSVYDYAFLFTVFFLIVACLAWKTKNRILLPDVIYWLAISFYAWSAWISEFYPAEQNSLLYLAFLRWLTLTFFLDPINFIGFLSLIFCLLKSAALFIRTIRRNAS